MPKVFVVQDSDHSLEAAKKFGTIQVMLTFKDVQKGYGHCSLVLGDYLGQMEESDFLLCIGDPIAIGIAVHLCIDQLWKFHVLKWDKRHHIYNPELIEL